MSDWSMASEAGAAPVYTPTASTIGPIHDTQSVVVAPSSQENHPSTLDSALSPTSSQSEIPDTALAIFRYEFTTLPRRINTQSNFTLKDHPMEWPTIIGLNNYTLDKNFVIASDNGAAKLLVLILWGNIIYPKRETNMLHYVFWLCVSIYAAKVLFNFHGAPEKYLGWIQNVKQRKKGLLEGIISGDGQKFFTVGRGGYIIWLSDTEGLELAKHVIGELPTLKLELI
ncbi:hypothetical protein N431DRAFT_400530 [Stipitochalara longipes BDJ]|nr:hypothetical protein N431DRAFT_400530 [Stipitochalara longipes BDJ]